MDAGMAPTHGLVSFCSCVWLVQHKRTLKAHPAQIEDGEVREHRDLIRDCATELVAFEAELLERRCERHEHAQRLGKR